MKQVTLLGSYHPGYINEISAAVAEYASANPSVTASDQVTVIVNDADGEPCPVRGTFAREVSGKIIFIVISGLLAAVKQAVSNARTRRIDKLRGRGRRAADAVATVVKEAIDVLEELLDSGVLTRNGSMYVHANGQKWRGKANTLAAIEAGELK